MPEGLKPLQGFLFLLLSAPPGQVLWGLPSKLPKHPAATVGKRQLGATAKASLPTGLGESER